MLTTSMVVFIAGVQHYYKGSLGKENLVAYFLSGVPKTTDPLPVEDKFANGHLFDVTIKMPWYVDVANYLAAGKLPAHLPPWDKKLIIHRSAWFS